jgi:putative endonuclease
MKAFMYILKCANEQFYVGSTTDLDKRINEHQLGEGANFTRKHLPVELVYYELFDRIDFAFSREKQIQKWSKAKKTALIESRISDLVKLSNNR